MTMLTAGRHRAAVNGFELGYVVMGKGPLLFAVSPGWGVGSAYLQRGMAPLCKDFTVVCIDTRGSGSSTRPADEAAMGSAAMADDIDQLRQVLGLNSIDLMGHSNGGAIALSYAERYPSACRKLVLIGSQLIGFSGGEATQEFLTSAIDDPRYRDAVSYVGLPWPDADEAFTQRLNDILPLYFHQPQKFLPLFRETLDGLVSARAFHAQREADGVPSSDQTAGLDRITAETLILVGRHDWICPPVVSDRLHAGIKRSKLMVFESTGHMPWIEEPARFFSAITHFLGP